MRDDGFDIQSSLEETGQSIPGAEKTTACDAVHSDPFEYDFIRQIEADRSGWDTEQRDSPAILDRTEDLMQCRWIPGHFQRGVDTFTRGDRSNGRGERVPCF